MIASRRFRQRLEGGPRLSSEPIGKLGREQSEMPSGRKSALSVCSVYHRVVVMDGVTVNSDA